MKRAIKKHGKDKRIISESNARKYPRTKGHQLQVKALTKYSVPAVKTAPSSKAQPSPPKHSLRREWVNGQF